MLAKLPSLPMLHKTTFIHSFIHSLSATLTLTVCTITVGYLHNNSHALVTFKIKNIDTHAIM